MMEYIIEGKKYLWSYQDLREKYLTFVSLSNDEFVRRLPEALHLACFISFIKEIPTYVCLADNGIVHELAHGIHLGFNIENNTTTLEELRALFTQQLKLD